MTALSTDKLVALSGEQWGAAVNAMTRVFRRDMDVTRCPGVTTCRDALESAMLTLSRSDLCASGQQSEGRVRAVVDAIITDLTAALEFRTGRGDEVGYDNIATGISDSIDIVLRIALTPAPQPEGDVRSEVERHLHDIINCGNCAGSRQSARLALRALKGNDQ